MDQEIFDTIVIGAGAYGLALGRELQEKGIRFVILEADVRVGEQWRRRYDSLVLFTPRYYSSLPGFPFPGEQRGYPTKEEVAEYLLSYEKKFELPVIRDARVSRVSFHKGVFEVMSSRGTYQAKSLALAVGAFQKPFSPNIPNDGSVSSLHSSAYRNPTSLQGEKILVVGAGNSGAQIAEELAHTGRKVIIVAREMPRCVLREFIGMNFFWWYRLFGRLHAPAHGKKTNPLIGCSLRTLIKKGHITFKRGEVQKLENGKAFFADGSVEPVDAILWATGYVRDTSFVDASAQSAPGIFSVGEEQRPRRSSGLIVGAALDARETAEKILRFLNLNL